MTDINKSDVYYKAAEIIVRDGKTEGTLTGWGDRPDDIKNRALPVCAIGACYRAHWELYGTLPEAWGMEVYAYEFRVPWTFKTGTVRSRVIWSINDDDSVSAEDVALLLKRKAAEVDGG